MTGLSAEGRQRITDMAGGDGWFHTGDEDMAKLAVRLIDLGVEECAALDVLESAYDITANEFGS